MAKDIIEAEIQSGRPPVWTPAYCIDLNHRVVDKKKQIETALLPNTPVIMDRGIPDARAYARYYGEADQGYILDPIAKRRYQTVFLMKPFGTFEQDGIRFENADFAREFDPILIQAYLDSGYEVVNVTAFPYGEGHYNSTDEKKAASIKQRTQFILQHLATVGISQHSTRPQ